MAQYLDFFRSEESREIVFLAVLQGDGSLLDLVPESMDDIVGVLTQRHFTVVYDRPFMHLRDWFMEETIEDFEVRKYYFNLFRFLEEQTGLEVSISGLMKGMFSKEFPTAFIPKVDSRRQVVQDFSIQQAVYSRVEAIRLAYETIKATGSVSFYHKRALYCMEVDTDVLLD